MKLFKKSLFLLFASIFLLTSCKEKTPPQLKAIPANAIFVVALENQEMIQKGGLNNLSDYQLFQKAKTEMKDMDPVLQKFFDEFLKDPKSSGVDINKAYIYGVASDSNNYCSVILKMDNQSTFEKKMTELFQAQSQPLPEIKDLGGVKLASMNGDATAAWNGELLQLFMGETSTLDYKSLFDLPADKSILSVADFVTFQKNKHDVGCWVAYGEALGFFQKMNLTMPSYINDFKDSYVHGYLDFENGEIKAMASMSPQSKVDEFLKKYPLIKEDFNTAILEDFPDKSFLLAKLSINWTEYLKLLNESMAQMQGMDVMNTYQEMLNDSTVKTVLDVIDGDMIFSLYNLAQGPLPLPLAGLSFTLKKEGDFERLLSLFPAETFTKNGNYYSLSTPFMVGVYFGCKDKRVLITDDAEAIAKFVDKGYSPNLKSSAMSNELKKSPAYFYMNLDLDTYPENLKALLAGNNIPEEAKAGLAVLKPLKDMSYSVNEKNEVIFSLKFKDSKQNSLKTLLKLADDAASKQINQ